MRNLLGIEVIFQSTPFSRRETGDRLAGRGTMGISIHSLLTKGDLNLTSPVVTLVISIHSLLTKGDGVCLCDRLLTGISIHSLLTKGDWPSEEALTVEQVFQSTPFSRRET